MLSFSRFLCTYSRRTRSFTCVYAPGDLVHLKLGDIVPADVTLGGNGDFHGGGGHGGGHQSMLEIDQAALTGESLPVTMFAGDVAKVGCCYVLVRSRTSTYSRLTPQLACFPSQCTPLYKHAVVFAGDVAWRRWAPQ